MNIQFGALVTIDQKGIKKAFGDNNMRAVASHLETVRQDLQEWPDHKMGVSFFADQREACLKAMIMLEDQEQNIRQKLVSFKDQPSLADFMAEVSAKAEDLGDRYIGR